MIPTDSSTWIEAAASTRILPSPTNPIRVHLACGLRRLPGWVHVDARDDVGADYVARIEDGLPFDTETVDAIYLCHGLEHLRRADVPDAIDEFRRVLRPGGMLYLAVPDLDSIALLLLNGVYLDRLIGPLYGKQNYEGNFHFSGYNHQYLASILQRAGFWDIERCDRFPFFDSEYDDYSQSRIDGMLISLNLICKR